MNNTVLHCSTALCINYRYSNPRKKKIPPAQQTTTRSHSQLIADNFLNIRPPSFRDWLKSQRLLTKDASWRLRKILDVVPANLLSILNEVCVSATSNTKCLSAHMQLLIINILWGQPPIHLLSRLDQLAVWKRAKTTERFWMSSLHILKHSSAKYVFLPNQIQNVWVLTCNYL